MSNQPILKTNFSIGGCGVHAVGYDFVERGDSNSILTTMNLFYVQLMYCIHWLSLNQSVTFLENYKPPRKIREIFCKMGGQHFNIARGMSMWGKSIDWSGGSI